MKLAVLFILSAAALSLGPSHAVVVHQRRGHRRLLRSPSSPAELPVLPDEKSKPSPETLAALRKMIRQLSDQIKADHAAAQKRLDRLGKAFDNCPRSPAADFRQEELSEQSGETLCVRHEKCYNLALSAFAAANSSIYAGQSNRTAKWTQLKHTECLMGLWQPAGTKAHSLASKIDSIVAKDGCERISFDTEAVRLVHPPIPKKHACAEGASAADEFLSSLHAKSHPAGESPLSMLPSKAHKQMLVLMRTGGPHSKSRLQNVRRTWAQDLEPGSLVLLEGNGDCKAKYGDNHALGLTCLEAKADLKLMNRTDFDWLLVVDDDAYVFADRLRATLKGLTPGRREVYGVTGCGNCGGGRKGLCGGGGFLLSRQSLLSMAGLQAAPVPKGSQDSFLARYMSPPTENYSDVRFGCVAQDAGLRLVHVKGMYAWHEDFGKERGIVALQESDPPLVMHYIANAWHMQRLRREQLLQVKRQRESSITPYAFAYWPVGSPIIP